jgi:hypothetical protein
MRLLVIGGLLAGFAVSAQAQTITIGNTTKFGTTDHGNGNLVAGQGPYNLSAPATLASLSFWVSVANGLLVLGIYTSGPNNKCAGGALVAQTAEFTPVKQSWNSKPPETAVTLQPGNYCLAYMPSSNSLSFRKGIVSGVVDPVFGQAFGNGAMPATFSATPEQPNGDGYSWSFYATLSEVSLSQTPIAVLFNPASASVSDNAAPGTTLAAVQVQTSDALVFKGTLSITTQTISGLASLSSASIPSTIQVASIAPTVDGQQSVTVQACENNVCVSGSLPVTVTAAPPPPSLSLTFNPAMPSVAQNLAPRALVATAVATWSDGSPFTGTYAFGSPYENDGGEFAIDPNSGAITVGASGLPADDANTVQNITVVATQ